MALSVILIPPYLVLDSETKKKSIKRNKMNKLDHVLNNNIKKKL